MNEYYEKLTKQQIDKIYKEKSKWTAKYLAIYCENSHLKKSMITLSCKKNTYLDTLKLRNYVIKKLNNVKHYKGYELAYFSAIEIDSSKNNEDIHFRNWHIHIQLHTNIPDNKVQEILNKLPNELCQYSKLTIDDNDIDEDNEVIFDYCIKDLKNINWELQHTMKTLYPKKQLYTSNRKGIADYVYKGISKHMRDNYTKQWKEIKNKYGYMLDLLKNKQIISFDRTVEEDMEYCLNKYKDYDYIDIKKKNLLIQKDLFSKS